MPARSFYESRTSVTSEGTGPRSRSGHRQGDRAAFTAMTRAYYAELYDFAHTYVGSPEAADLVQDVLLNVWAMRNRALNHLRAH